MRRFAALLALAVLLAVPVAQSRTTALYRIDHVADGDTVDLRNGQKVRLVQIDTPEVYFGTECYGPQASALTKQLLPPGTAVRLSV
jgi:endonuclease YncB( thermonuclease family)